MFKSLFPKFNKESFAQHLENVPKEFHKYMVEQQRFIRLRKKIQRYEEEIIKLQEKIYPRGTEETLSPEERLKGTIRMK